MSEVEATWAAKTDDEVVKASRELFDYTEAGERIIRSELQRRGLPQPDLPIGRCARCGRSIAFNHPRDECSECGEPFPPEILRVLGTQAPEGALVPVLRAGDAGLILLAKSLLEEEGIEYLVRGDNLQDLFGVGRLGGYNYITGPAEFCVRTGDVERARILLDGLSEPAVDPAVDPNDDA